MKIKILLSTFCLLFSSLLIFAKPVVDSIGEKNVKGKRVIIFKVKAKDTYYSIGRRYNVKPKVLMDFNKSKKKTLSIGDIVMVPTGEPFKPAEKVVKETPKAKKARLAAEAKAAKLQKQQADSKPSDNTLAEKQPVENTPQSTTNQDSYTTIQYKVLRHETMYSIAKRYNASVADVLKWNNLKSPTLKTGQVLVIKQVISSPLNNIPSPANQIATTQTINQETPVAKRDSTLVAPVTNQIKDSLAEHNFNTSKFGLYEKDEKGAATWIDDTSLDPNKKLVLHRTAPIGTVIKITNPLTNRSTFAKVVGRFTENESTKDVIIVMTKNVADALGALDKRFHVSISYGSPNE